MKKINAKATEVKASKDPKKYTGKDIMNIETEKLIAHRKLMMDLCYT